MKDLINGLTERFKVETKLSESSYQIYLRNANTTDSKTQPLYISLIIASDYSNYKIECFEVKNGNKNGEELTKMYSVKVEGPWSLKGLQEDLLKMAKREFKNFRPRYYPF